MRGSRIFCQFCLVLSLFTVYRGDPMVLSLRKLYLYFTKDPEGSIIFEAGIPTFSRGGGVQMLISIKYVLVIFQGVSRPPIPL